MSTLSKADRARREEAIVDLRKVCPPGTTIYTVVRHVARSGMSRVLSAHVVKDGVPEDITIDAGYALGLSRKDGWTYNGVRVDGCGQDMGFWLVHNLSYIIHPDGFGCLGDKIPIPGRTDRVESCCSNEHAHHSFSEPPDRDYTPGHWHKTGGYSLIHKWL